MTAPVAPRATAVPCISCGNRTAMSLNNQPVCGTCQREGVNSESAQVHKARHASQSVFLRVNVTDARWLAAIRKATTEHTPVYGDGPFFVFGTNDNYTVEMRNGGVSCPCVAGKRGIPCYHAAAAHLRAIKQAPRLCGNCGVDGAAVGSANCSPCDVVLRQREMERMAYRAQVRAEAAAGISPLDAAFN